MVRQVQWPTIHTASALTLRDRASAVSPARATSTPMFVTAIVIGLTYLQQVQVGTLNDTGDALPPGEGL